MQIPQQESRVVGGSDGAAPFDPDEDQHETRNEGLQQKGGRLERRIPSGLLAQ